MINTAFRQCDVLKDKPLCASLYFVWFTQVVQAHRRRLPSRGYVSRRQVSSEAGAVAPAGARRRAQASTPT